MPKTSIGAKRLQIDSVQESINTVKRVFQSNATFEKYLPEGDLREKIQARCVKAYMAIDSVQLKEKYCWMLSKYNYFPMESYPSLMYDSFIKLKNDFPQEKHFNLLPVGDARTIKSALIKSSNLVQYLYSGSTFKTMENDINLTRKFKYTQKDLQQNHKPWILVDDFIGTGESLIKSYNYWTKRGCIVEAALILVASKDGLKNIEEQIPDFNVYCGEKIPNICSPRDVSQISRALGIKDSGSKNYCTGVLVTMARTPNNTVPCFYKIGHSDKNKARLLPPFRRR